MASPEEMQASMIANLPEKTGKSLDEWVAIVQAAGLAKHGEMVKLLKQEHGVSHGYANLIVHTARADSSAGAAPAAASAPADGDLVEAQYAGKADLRPIYESLVRRITSFGDDVELAPKKAYVSLRRSKQFGLIQPSTKTRVDVGIKLTGLEPAGRLEASGSWNSMVTHRVRIESMDEVDAELIAWLRRAYEEA